MAHDVYEHNMYMYVLPNTLVITMHLIMLFGVSYLFLQNTGVNVRQKYVATSN